MFLRILTKKGEGEANADDFWPKRDKKTRLAVIWGGQWTVDMVLNAIANKKSRIGSHNRQTQSQNSIPTDKNRDNKTFHSNSRTRNNREMLSVLSLLSQTNLANKKQAHKLGRFESYLKLPITHSLTHWQWYVPVGARIASKNPTSMASGYVGLLLDE